MYWKELKSETNDFSDAQTVKGRIQSFVSAFKKKMFVGEILKHQLFIYL